jgi:hypothetical protein
MATLKTAKAATARGGSDLQTERLGSKLNSQSIPSKPDLQEHRTIWIARRFRLAPTMAATVADLYFLEGAR